MTDARKDLPRVIRDLPGQEQTNVFLARSARRPHHAYLFSGPEGSGKRLAMRAFAAALVCPEGGCGACRACRLAQSEAHPNMLVLEPTGPDILVGKDASDHDTARWLAARVYLTPVEPGRKVVGVLQADRLRPEAADVLLKVLEEPPADTVFVLVSARPDDLPDTIRSRAQQVAFPALSEEFVVETLTGEGIGRERAVLASRLAGGNLGRARRIAVREDGLAFRDAALAAASRAARGPADAISAVDDLLSEAKRFQKRLSDELQSELEQYTDEQGRPQEPFRGVVRRLEEQYARRQRRAEREFLDWSLMSLASYLRDKVVAATGGGTALLINIDRPDLLEAFSASPSAAARAMGAVEDARADLADETNLNVRLTLERLFLRLSAFSANRGVGYNGRAAGVAQG